MVGENNGNLRASAIAKRETSTEEWVMNVDDIHGLEEFLVFGLVAHGKIKTRIRERQARASYDAGFVILMIEIAKGEDIYFVSCIFKGAFVQVNIIRDAADIRFIGVCHHSDLHVSIVQSSGRRVKKDED